MFQTAVKYIAVIFILLILQLAVMPVIFSQLLLPNLLLIFCLLLAANTDKESRSFLQTDQETVYIVAVTSGLLLDLFSSLWFGFYTILFIASVSLLYFIIYLWIESGINKKTIGIIFLITTIVIPAIFITSSKSLVPFSTFFSSVFIGLAALFLLAFPFYVRT